MWSRPDFILSLLTTFVAGFVVYLFVIRGLFRQFLFLNLYFLLLVGAEVGREMTLRHFGLASTVFGSFYFFSDGLLAIFLFLSICQLGTRLVGDLIPRRKIALFNLFLFVATVCISFPVASSGGFLDVTAVYAFRLSGNISLVGGLCIIALWVWKLRNNPSDWISAQLVNTLTVYFLLVALAFEGFQVAPRTSGLMNLCHMIEAWLPLGCGFALLTPEQRQTE